MSALTLTSSSRSEDAGYQALTDVAAVARELGADYRLVGGHMVSILVALHGVTGVPHRETNDADLGAAFSVIADQRLIDTLTDLGYRRPGASNRFVRPIEDNLDAVIDVLAPSYTGRHEPNQHHGSLVVDEIPGLANALATPPVVVEIEGRLCTGVTLRTTTSLPSPLPALCLKALAWRSRHVACQGRRGHLAAARRLSRGRSQPRHLAGLGDGPRRARSTTTLRHHRQPGPASRHTRPSNPRPHPGTRTRRHRSLKTWDGLNR